MINDFRKTVQEKLNSISGLSAGRIIADDAIKEGVYHFGYIITQNDSLVNLDYSNHTIIYNITGYLVTKSGKLSKFDSFADAIVYELSKLNMRAVCNDLSTGDETLRMSITGTVIYDTLDKLLK